jgi:molecular chaperone DnaK
MTIASSSGLSDGDIEKMVAEAERYAESDKARRSLIEEANKADSVCVDTEKGKLTEILSESCTQFMW